MKTSIGANGGDVNSGCKPARLANHPRRLQYMGPQEKQFPVSWPDQSVLPPPFKNQKINSGLSGWAFRRFGILSFSAASFQRAISFWICPLW